jgi:polyisoprenoid-binding protein YceI
MMARSAFLLLIIALSQSSEAFPAQSIPDVRPKRLRLGTLEFDASANVRTFDFKGVAQSLDGNLVFDGSTIRELRVRVPVESLRTGMTLRDNHMRKQIFETKDGKLPPVLLTAAGIACKTVAWDSVCPVRGNLEIQGIKKPFIAEVRLIQTPEGYEAKGSGLIKLSDYGIPQPEELGIKVANEVHLNFDLKAQ